MVVEPPSYETLAPVIAAPDVFFTWPDIEPLWIVDGGRLKLAAVVIFAVIVMRWVEL